MQAELTFANDTHIPVGDIFAHLDTLAAEDAFDAEDILRTEDPVAAAHAILSLNPDLSAVVLLPEGDDPLRIYPDAEDYQAGFGE